MISWILTLSILAGQLVKIPIGNEQGGATLLDITIVNLCLIGLLRLKFKLKSPPLFIKASLLFIFITILSLLLSPIKLNISQYINSFSYIMRFSFFIILGWLIYSGTFSDLKKNISNILIFSGIGLSILGILQLIFLPDLRFLEFLGWDPHYFRTVSTFIDPNFLGSYLVLTLILIVQSGVSLNKRIGNIFLILLFIALLTTFSRGAYLAFLTSFLTISFLYKSFRFGIITILLFALLLSGFFVYQRLVAQPRGIDRDQSAQLRFNTWQQGWQLFRSNPLLGVGFNTYRYALKQYNLGNEQFLKSPGSSTNDSSLLYVSATTGIIGIISYLFFLFFLFKTGWESYLIKNKWGVILIGGLVALLTQSFFANTLFYPFLLIWLIFNAIIQKK